VAVLWREFARADADGSGELSLAEFLAYLQVGASALCWRCVARCGGPAFTCVWLYAIAATVVTLSEPVSAVVLVHPYYV
jgi:hypothetical protein